MELLWRFSNDCRIDGAIENCGEVTYKDGTGFYKPWFKRVKKNLNSDTSYKMFKTDLCHHKPLFFTSFSRPILCFYGCF